MFSSVLTMYGHGLGSQPAHSLSRDLIDLCGAAGVSEGDSMACISKGQSITDYPGKMAYIKALSSSIKQCRYATCVISTPGDPVVAPGITTGST
mmetsp:Transcript_28334/g.67688  ORF Transcript_28334/g.67688 Transcript_28334/m.67688 type:complete len:94 (+) Transcript_28334:53-334(+)